MLQLLTPLGRGFEPHTAEDAVQAMADSAGPRLTIERRTGWLRSVATTGTVPRRIVSATALNGRTYCGEIWIDCSYEGDLLRLSGTAYAVGRESAAQYNESMAGTDGHVLNHTDIAEKQSEFAADVSPFVDSTNTTLLPTITELIPRGSMAPTGAGDALVQAYCFRMCLTNNASNAIPIEAPEGYTRAALELLRRELVSATRRGYTLQLRSLFLVRQLSSEKIDLNSGQWNTEPGQGGFFPFSTDLPFAQYGWPTGNASARAAIFAEHKWWTQALLYYLGNDPELARLQPQLIAEVKSFGLCSDEYHESADRWTPQLYVRESIRLVGERIITQADVCNPQPEPTSVGLSKWGVDVHAVRRIAAWDETLGAYRVLNAGGRDSGRQKVPFCRGGLQQVPYAALIPHRDDTANLFAPTCPSYSHIAFSTYRLEAQYAIFGHSVGAAAALALKQSATKPVVHSVSIAALQALLRAQQQLLIPPSPGPPAGFGCAAGVERCLPFSGDFHNSSSCGGRCPALLPNEWLANDCCGIWEHRGVKLVARTDTWLKKSTTYSSQLDPADKLAVSTGSSCTLVGTGVLHGSYRVCLV